MRSLAAVDLQRVEFFTSMKLKKGHVECHQFASVCNLTRWPTLTQTTHVINMSWERSVLPENNVLEIEGVLYDARGGDPDPQDVLQGGDVRRSRDSLHVTQVAGKWTQTGHSFIDPKNSIVHLVKIKFKKKTKTSAFFTYKEPRVTTEVK